MLSILSRHHVPSMLDPLTMTKPRLSKLTFPHRVIGTLSYLNVDKKQFGVLIKHENSNPESNVRLINDHYCTEDVEEVAEKEAKEVFEEGEVKEVPASKFNCKTCKFVPNSAAIVVGDIYAAYIEELNQVARVQVIEMNRSRMKTDLTPYQIKVRVLDYGMVTGVYETQLMFLDEQYTEGQYGTALALACQLPDTRLFNGAPFPKLDNFKYGDHIEVYVLSEEEPCLAVFGSLVTGPNSIPRQLFFYGIDPQNVESFNRAFSGNFSTEIEKYKGWTSKNWMHPNSWTLVTIASFEDLSRVAVRDVISSLQLLHLHQSINRCYKKAGFSHVMKVDPTNLFSGSPVIVYYSPLDAYIRGTITNVHYSGNGCDVEALDIPDLTVSDVPTNMVYYPSSDLLNIPPLVFYVNLMKESDTMERDIVCDSVKEILSINSVAIFKLSLDYNGAQLECNKKDNVNAVIDDCLYKVREDNRLGLGQASSLSRSSSFADSLNNVGLVPANLDNARLVADGHNF